MHRWLALMLLFVGLRPVTAQQAGPEGEPLEVPAGGALWIHEKTGLAFPSKLGDLQLEGGFAYKGPGLGISLRYVDKDLRARADVYVYPCARPHGDADAVQAALRSEAGSVLGELDLMRKRGTYAAVSHDDAIFTDFELKSGEKSGEIILPLHFTINEDRGAGIVPTRVESLLGLTLYQGHWVKLRFTWPGDLGKKGEEARDKFVKQAFRCVTAADWRKDLRGWIVTYRKDPLSKAAIDEAGAIMVFAEEFPVVQLVVGESVVKFGAECEKRFPEATQHVLRAFIVGATDAAVEGRTQAEVVAAAVREVSVLCNMWQKRDAGFTPPSVSDFEAAACKENKVVPAVKPQGSKAKRNPQTQIN